MSTNLENTDDKPLEFDLDDDIELEIVDDKPAGKGASGAGDDAAQRRREDADVEKAGGRTQQRIDRLTAERETAFRERDAAISMARDMRARLDRSETAVVTTSDVLVNNNIAAAEAAVAAAREGYKKAHADGDADAMVAAQESLNNAQIDFRAAQHNKVVHESRKREWEESQKGAPAGGGGQGGGAPANSGQPQLTDRDRAWQDANADWWGKDKEMSGFALGLSDKLIAEGIPRGSEDYYRKIDARMRQVFQDREWSDDDAGTSGKGGAPARQPSSPVAPASRGGGGTGRKVKLSASEVAVCRELGVDPKQYAKEKYAEETRNGGR